MATGVFCRIVVSIRVRVRSMNASATTDRRVVQLRHCRRSEFGCWRKRLSGDPLESARARAASVSLLKQHDVGLVEEYYDGFGRCQR